jgi:predicted nuclease with TOPRIM domain
MPKPASNLQRENNQLKAKVRELTAEVKKLHNRAAQIEVKNLSAVARIKALEKEKVPPKPKALSEMEVARRIAFVLARAGMHIVDASGRKVEP